MQRLVVIKDVCVFFLEVQLVLVVGSWPEMWVFLGLLGVLAAVSRVALIVGAAVECMSSNGGGVCEILTPDRWCQVRLMLQLSNLLS